MQNSSHTNFAFYIGFSENSLYSSKVSISLKLIDKNSFYVNSPELINFIEKYSSGNNIISENDIVDFFTDFLLVSLSNIVSNFNKPLHSISFKYSSISDFGTDNHDGIIRDIRLHYTEIDPNTRSKVIHLSKFFSYEDVHNFSKTSLSKILTNRKLNSELYFIIYYADPKFIN
uniref:Uncharacterized protein n=1 Tax=Orbilia oligospora TaxID=2813651 RepID=A0A481ZLV0_ORBOL|nr:hypothetical protein [Orbilia oligospora]QBL02017.1 hypothetical protein [Orbilia oligospora]